MACPYLVKSCNVNCRKQDHSSLVGCDAVLLGVVGILNPNDGGIRSFEALRTLHPVTCCSMPEDIVSHGIVRDSNCVLLKASL